MPGIADYMNLAQGYRLAESPQRRARSSEVAPVKSVREGPGYQIDIVHVSGKTGPHTGVSRGDGEPSGNIQMPVAPVAPVSRGPRYPAGQQPRRGGRAGTGGRGGIPGSYSAPRTIGTAGGLGQVGAPPVAPLLASDTRGRLAAVRSRALPAWLSQTRGEAPPSRRSRAQQSPGGGGLSDALAREIQRRRRGARR